MSASRMLGVVALILGAAAPFAGSPYRSLKGPVDVRGLSAVVAREEDSVDAQQLARWIRDREPGLRVIDLRSEVEYSNYRIPGAEHAEIASIDLVAKSKTGWVVIYSEGDAQAAQTWVFLRAMGLHHVFFLRGGLRELVQ